MEKPSECTGDFAIAQASDMKTRRRGVAVADIVVEIADTAVGYTDSEECCRMVPKVEAWFEHTVVAGWRSNRFGSLLVRRIDATSPVTGRVAAVHAKGYCTGNTLVLCLQSHRRMRSQFDCPDKFVDSIG